jgi:hypothetical protein
MKRWRGLKDLLVDAVHHGVTAVEVVHRRTTRATIDVVASVPGLGPPVRAVGALQDAAIAATYETIRQVNGALGAAVGLILDAAERLPRGPIDDRTPPGSHL